MLEAYRVLDLSDEKGQLCGRMLADLGADVIQVEPPGGSPARKLGPFYHDIVDPEKSLFWFAVNANKRSITLDLETEAGGSLLKRLVPGAHFLIESFPPGYLDARGLGYAALSSLHPGLIMVSITPFGQQGPRAHWVTSDIVSMAMGGIMSVAGEPHRPPVRVSEPQAYFHAGAQAAAAALIAHYHRLKTGEGQHVDVSIQEAVMWANSEVPQFWDLTGTSRNRGDRMMGRGSARTKMHHLCKDGYVAFSMGAGPRGGPNVYPLIRWMEQEGAAEALGEMKHWSESDWLEATPEVLNQERIDSLETAVEAFFSRHTKLELQEWAVRNGVTLYMVSSPKDLLESPQLAARDYFAQVEHPELGDRLTYPAGGAKTSVESVTIRRNAPLIGEHNREILEAEMGLSGVEPAALGPMGVGADPRELASSATPRHGAEPAATPSPTAAKPRAPLEGLRVVEFAWVAAGPMTGKQLAEHGAQVIRVESATRIDALRNMAPWKDNVYGINRSGFFARYNSNKWGITLDLTTRRGLEIARRLIARADIVTESFSAGTMVRMGLGYRAIRAINPRIIMLSTNIHGQAGPWAEQGGAGNTGAAVAGVTHFVGWPQEPPMYIGVPYTDYVAPSFALAAIMAALDHRERTGEGQYIDISQVECAIRFLAPAVMDYTINGRMRERIGNRSLSCAPHGVYRCRGEDRWCAIAVESEEQWQAFCRATGEPEWAKDPRFATMVERLAHAGELDSLVESWAVQLSPEAVMQRLQEAGVPAGVVQRGEDLFQDPQVAHRDHFVYLEHRELGRHAYERMSYRFSKTPGRLERAAPCLGQDTELVLREELGFTQEEIEQAVQEGALGW